MREIVMDTETTGLNPKGGDRLVEVGCVEIVDRMPTGVEFHCYINPDRDVPEEVVRVHGLTGEFLADKPRFEEVVDDFITFIDDSPLVIHNASFDIGFLNAELSRARRLQLSMDRVIDTLDLAKRKHPAGPNSLDALCKRYGIDNSIRTKHGALVDSLLLAEVYLELLGERQTSLGLAVDAQRVGRGMSVGAQVRARPQPLTARLSNADREAHRAFVSTLKGDVIWARYMEKVETG
ncbi:MAG: DNA polymerase III subunit epsilon [Pseudomonadota bacterium]